jgi:thiazole synthase
MTTTLTPTTEPGLSPFRIAGKAFNSRLLVGTGKYPTMESMAQSLDAANAEIITVAVRRERLFNTAGCFSAEDAIRVSRLGRDLLEQLDNPGANWVKLEVLGDKKTLLPDPVGTIEAVKELTADGFNVLCYSSDDPITALRIKEAGATSVMPAGSPIGSGQGVLNQNNLVLCLELLKENDPTYPVVIDAGVGSASDVAVAMELGADAVLLNTAIAHAKDPIMMAHAMRKACEAGHQSYLAGRIPKKRYATASSPMEGTISYIPGE